MIIRNVELPEIDLMDADVADKFETVFANAAEEVKKLQEDHNCSRADGIRAVCRTIFNCFNVLFGEGTDKKLFGNSYNMRDCFIAFSELAKVREQQDAEFKETFGESNT